MGLEFPANRVSGRLKNNSNVNSWNRGQQILRAFTLPPNPDTPDQQAVRTAFSLLTKNWKVLTTAQTNAWDAWAVANPITNRLGNVVSRTGLSAYVELGSLHYYRTGALLAAAPTLARPSPPTSLAQIGAQNPDSIGITITHSLPNIANLWWLVSMTPTLPSVKVTPALPLYRMVRGVNTNSFVAVAASPDEVLFSPTKYDVQDGGWYGVEVQTVNIEGYASIPIRAQFAKLI
jgi:hypothetical protein